MANLLGMENPQEQLDPASYHYQTEIHLRFRDLDAMGHVNNAVFITFFEVGRAGYIMSLDPSFEPNKAIEQFPFIMLDAACRYLAPIKMHDHPVVHVRTNHIGTKSLNMQYLITDRDSGQPKAVGHTTLVYYDYRAEKTQPIPDEAREMLSRFEKRPFPKVSKDS